MRVGAIGSKVKQHSGTMTNVTAPSVAKKAGSSTVGADRACFYERSRENKCGYDIPNLVGRVCAPQPICHRHRQRK